VPRRIFAFHYPNLLDTVNFLVLIKLNDYFDIDILLFELVKWKDVLDQDNRGVVGFALGYQKQKG
jgi:hypothetical protein